MRRRWVVLAATCLMVAGCGGGEEGEPVAAAAAPVEEFEPCSIPAEAIEATGLNPASEDAGWGQDLRVDDWTRCVWDSRDAQQPYSFRILFSANHDLDDIRRGPEYTDMTPILVNEHEWLRYKFKTTAPDGRCNVAYDTTKGVATAVVRFGPSMTANIDPCDVVLHHATDLARYLPPQK